MSFSGWFFHTPNVNPKPVEDGVWVKVIDNEGYIHEGWSQEFDWTWRVDPLGNIIRYCVRESSGVKLLKDLVAIIPDKGRMDILI